ncbi:hypothetical protein EMIT0P253_60092 [Pseudomonas sp. IT-P253]
MLMDVRACSAANATEELSARRVIGTAIANFLNIIEYLSFSMDWFVKSLLDRDNHQSDSVLAQLSTPGHNRPIH